VNGVTVRAVKYRLAAIAVAGCASAGAPGETTDAATDAPIDRDAGIDAPPDAADLCPSADTCAAAMMLGSVSGDTQNQKLMASGYRSAWFRVRVTENDDNFPGLTLRVASKLTAPSGVAFDTFVYVNAGNDVPSECSTTTGTKTTNGGVTQVRAEWGEGGIPNGSDDSRNVSIEVRPVGTNCSPSAMWQLEVEGNWL
jgi:hypothetical protein